MSDTDQASANGAVSTNGAELPLAEFRATLAELRHLAGRDDELRAALVAEGAANASTVPPDRRAAVLRAMRVAIAAREFLDGVPANPASTAVMFGAGVNVEIGTPIQVRNAAELATELERRRGTEDYFCAGTFFNNHRKNEHCEQLVLLIEDIDFHDVAGKHTAPPDELRPRLEQAARDSGATHFWHTPRGGRVIVMLDRPCADVELWKRTSRAQGARLAALLAGTGFRVDNVSHTPAQLFFTPNTRDKNGQRSARVQVFREAVSIESLLDSGTSVSACAPSESAGAATEAAQQATPDATRLTPAAELTADETRTWLDLLDERIKNDSRCSRLSDGDWRSGNYHSSSEGHYVLAKIACRIVRNAGAPDHLIEQLVVEWLLTRTAWGGGDIDSPNAKKYTRRDWVARYAVSSAAADVRLNDPPIDKVFDDLGPAPAAPRSVTSSNATSITIERAKLEPGSLSRTPPPRDYLLRHAGTDAGFAPTGVAGILASEGGVGKTACVVACAASVITGRPWLGFEVDPAHVGQHVLLVLAEETADEAQRRLFDVAEDLQLSEVERRELESKLHVLALAGEPCALAEFQNGVPALTPAFKQLVELLRSSGEPWAMVVLDPLARLVPGAEGDNVLATFAVQILERLTDVPGRPLVLVAHHSSKIARRAGDVDARGVTGLADAARLVWTLKATKGGAVEFFQQKANYAPPMARPLILRRGRGGLLRLASDDEIEAEQAAKVDAAVEQVAADADAVVEALKGAPGGRAKTKAAIAKLCRMKAERARQGIDRALAESRIVQDGPKHDRWYRTATVADGGAEHHGGPTGGGGTIPPYPRDRGTAGPDASLGPSVPAVSGPGTARDRGIASAVDGSALPLSPSPNGSSAGPRDRGTAAREAALAEFLGGAAP